jgi:hypothetical protein
MDLTVRHIAEALRAVLSVAEFSPEEQEFMAGLEIDEALGLAYTLLLESGHDPDTLLRNHDILENSP